MANRQHASPPEFEIAQLLDTAVVSVRDVSCLGECRHRSAEECGTATQLVFPYRGVYLRHVGYRQHYRPTSTPWRRF